MTRAAGTTATRIVAVCSAVTAVAAAVLVTGPGYEAARVRMYTGAVWLASNRTGEASLVDGTSGEVRARVPVAGPGTALTVAQHGGAAFVANQRTGELSRVDSATERVSPAAADLPAGGGLVVKPAQGVVHGVDVHSGTVVSVDPDTLRSSGERTRLAAALEPDSVVVDGRGRLWAIDTTTGDLVWLAGGERRSRPAAARLGRLTITADRPVLVDPGRGTAELLHPGTGVVADTVRPDLSAGDSVAVSGSADRARVLIANGTRGELVVCEFDTRSCAAPVRIGEPGAEFGAPVEIDGHAVVPDHATGRATIVHLAGARVVAQGQLFERPTRFELLVHDGVVFFNDADGDRAGILELTGEFRTVTKYTGEPAEGDHRPESRPQPEQVTKAGQQPGRSVPGNADRSRQPEPTPLRPSASVVVKPGTRGEVGDEFELTLVLQPAFAVTARWTFGDGTEAEGTTVRHTWTRTGAFTVRVTATLGTGKQVRTETTVTVEPAGAPPRIAQLAVQRPKPVIGESVHFSADASGKPDRWAWTVTRPGQQAPEVTARTPEFDHRFTAPGRYTVTLTIARGSKTATLSRQFTVARGAVEGWGSNLAGVMNIPQEVKSGVIAIDAATGHALALKADGSVIAWGRENLNPAPVPPELSSGVIAVAAGEWHSLALKADGSVIGWAYAPSFGQGVVPPAAQRDAVAIAAGRLFSLVVKKDGSVVAWGGRPDEQTVVPPAAQSGVVAVAGGSWHSLALKVDGSVIAWGGNYYGGTDVPPEAREEVIAIAAEHGASMALKSDGSLIAWGGNDDGPFTLPPEARSGVIAMDACSMHGLALKADGSVVGWGQGPDRFGARIVPPKYRSGGVMAVAAGLEYSLVLVEEVE